jgi:hypothetical protein
LPPILRQFRLLLVELDLHSVRARFQRRHALVDRIVPRERRDAAPRQEVPAAEASGSAVWRANSWSCRTFVLLFRVAYTEALRGAG